MERNGHVLSVPTPQVTWDCPCLVTVTLAPSHTTRTTLKATAQDLILAFKAVGPWVSSSTTNATFAQPLLPAFLISHFPRSCPLPECPLLDLLCQGTSVQPQRVTMEMLLSQGSLTAPFSGEPESLSLTLPWASGAFRHPSIYSLFKSGATGHIAGREGGALGLESRFCDLPGGRAGIFQDSSSGLRSLHSQSNLTTADWGGGQLSCALGPRCAHP